MTGTALDRNTRDNSSGIQGAPPPDGNSAGQHGIGKPGMAGCCAGECSHYSVTVPRGMTMRAMALIWTDICICNACHVRMRHSGRFCPCCGAVLARKQRNQTAAGRDIAAYQVAILSYTCHGGRHAE